MKLFSNSKSQSIVFIFSIIAISIFNNCASTYKPISLQPLSFPVNNIDSAISFSYRYDILNETDNKKYAKHENDLDIRLVAVKFTNNSKKEINLSQNISYIIGGKEIIPINRKIIQDKLSQGVGGYFLYLLLTPLVITKTTQNGYGPPEVDKTHIGYILGPGLMIGNMAVASSANKDFSMDLLNYDLSGKTLQPGESAYGLIGFQDIGYQAINIKVK